MKLLDIINENKLIHHVWNKIHDNKLKHAKCTRCNCEKYYDDRWGKVIFIDRFGKTHHHKTPDCVLPNTKLNKQISEEPNESVADKYIQQDPQLSNVPREFDDFEKYYREKEQKEEQNGEIIYEDNNLKIIKNPQTFHGIGNNVRGVISSNGDLYVEEESTAIHNDILSVLKSKGIVPPTTSKLWGGQLPQQSGFLTVQRYKDTNIMAIGESNRLIYAKDDWNKYIKYYDIFLNKAQSKIPKIQFTNKLIGIKTDNSSGNDNILNKPTSSQI
jgi:hypothetical protein